MASPRPTSTNIQPSAPEKNEPAPTGKLSDAPKIALPKSLAQTLQFLSDDDLETLRVKVETELGRRCKSSAGSIERKAAAPQPATAAKASKARQEERDTGSAIPAGRVSLIKASYRAGMKPVAIARSLRVSLSVVNKVLGTEAKARR
jgi:antitoxin component of MazEF toxin-antitoxin module